MATAEERFTELYERHYAEVERYVRRRAADAAVRDVVAETFLVAWRRFAELPAEPLPWLYGTARRVLANEVRAVRRQSELATRVAEHLDIGAADHADDVAGLVSLAAAFQQLSETDAEALRLIGWEHLTLRQAAKVCGCSMPAFAMRLHRARTRLQRALAAPASSTPLMTLGGKRS